MPNYLKEPGRVYKVALYNLLTNNCRKSRREARTLLGLIQMRKCPICDKRYRWDEYHNKTCSDACLKEYHGARMRAYWRVVRKERRERRQGAIK